MRCPTCSTELRQPANFCPVCGTPLRQAGESPHPHAGTPAPQAPNAASEPGDAEGNVVYLHPQQPPAALAGEPVAGGPPQNPRAGDYQQAPDASGPATVPRGVLPHDAADRFFDDSSTFVFDDDDDEPAGSRLLGSTLLLLVAALVVVAVVVYAVALGAGAGGAQAGGFVLLAALLWISYLALPRDQQHGWVLRANDGLNAAIDRRVEPLRRRTATQLDIRRERERYDAMRDERSRRVNALGEAAYREFRGGTLQPSLAPHAQRILGMEQQMLMQDARLHELQQQRDAAAAAPPPKRRRERGNGDGRKG